jgi:hypothetical protein
MNYQTFQSELANEVRHRMGGMAEVSVRTVLKNNGIVRSAMEVRKEGSDLSPSIYMDDFYAQYRKGVSVEHLANLVLEQCSVYGKEMKLPDDFFRDYREVRKGLFCKLINRELNAEEVESVPSRPWMDLAFVCCYKVEETILKDASIRIRREHLKLWGVSEKRLFHDAWENTKRGYPPILLPLGDVLREMGACVDEPGCGTPLYLLSNEQKCFGAACIGYPGMPERLAKELGGDFYLIPSSIHEFLLLRADAQYEMDKLNHMVREINATQLDPQDVLANHVYFYDAEKKRLTGEGGESLCFSGESVVGA